VKKSLWIILFALACLSARAQRPGYDISFHQIFDNREFFSEFAFPQTIFGARLDASLVFSIDTMHSFAAGLNYLYEHGSSVLGVTPQVNLYYVYQSDQLELAFGSFPRRDRIDMPLVFLADTLHYYRPNVEGGYVAFGGRHIEVYGFVDWTGRVSKTTREAFLAEGVMIPQMVVRSGTTASFRWWRVLRLVISRSFPCAFLPGILLPITGYVPKTSPGERGG